MFNWTEVVLFSGGQCIKYRGHAQTRGVITRERHRRLVLERVVTDMNCDPDVSRGHIKLAPPSTVCTDFWYIEITVD